VAQDSSDRGVTAASSPAHRAVPRRSPDDLDPVVATAGDTAVRQPAPPPPAGNGGARQAVGRPPGDRADRTPRLLAIGVGVFSLGLGSAQVAAPGLLNRAVGLEDSTGNRALMRLMGARELGHGAGILTGTRTDAWLGSRVAGDALDLAVLGGALGPGTRPRAVRPRRLVGAIAAVAGVTALDAATLMALRRTPHPSLGQRVFRTALTVHRPVDEVYAAWRDFERLPTFMTHLHSVEVLDEHRSQWTAETPGGGTVSWVAEIVQDRPGELISWQSVDGATVPNAGTVRFAPAPGDRGTEVRLELTVDVPAGAAGRAVATLTGQNPAQQATDDLRRFKQVLETGEVVRSDATPEGVHARRLLRQRPGRPA